MHNKILNLGHVSLHPSLPNSAATLSVADATTQLNCYYEKMFILTIRRPPYFLYR